MSDETLGLPVLWGGKKSLGDQGEKLKKDWNTPHGGHHDFKMLDFVTGAIYPLNAWSTMGRKFDRIVDRFLVLNKLIIYATSLMQLLACPWCPIPYGAFFFLALLLCLFNCTVDGGPLWNTNNMHGSVRHLKLGPRGLIIQVRVGVNVCPSLLLFVFPLVFGAFTRRSHPPPAPFKSP